MTVEQSVRRVGKQAARAAATAIGRSTSAVRLQPGFLIIGAQRCGTTSLFRYLVTHPAVVPPVFQKGIHYFDTNYARGWSWYRGHFPLAAVAERRAASVNAQPITGEASPYYLFHPHAARRIATDLPNARLIVLLRDPVERAYSAWKQESVRGFETEPFERALELEEQRLDGELERMLADETYSSFSHQHHAYQARGRYDEQLTHLFGHVPREQVLVLEMDQLETEPASVWHEVLGFLDLPEHRLPAFERHNARPSSPLDPMLRARLESVFAPHDERLAELLGRPPAWRR